MGMALKFMKIRQSKKNSCKRKVKHETLEGTQTAAQKMRTKTRDLRIVEYGCPFCGFFHIGHEKYV
jgi:hypothetical protein